MIGIPNLTGHSRYASEPEGNEHVLVAVACRLGSKPQRILAMVDTASEWCVASPTDFEDSSELVRLSDARLHCRFGLIHGHLVRAAVTFSPDGGDELNLEATWFISEDWTGPVVVGWKGCLERMNFALDTGRELFWFGAQEVP